MYQLCASGTLSSVEKGLLSPTRTHSLSPFTSPNPGPAKSGRQILLKPSLILIYACGLLLHTPTQTHLFQVMCTELFSLVFPCLCAQIHTHPPTQRRPKSFHAMCHCFRTKQVIRPWVESSLHMVLSVGSTSLTAGRI